MVFAKLVPPDHYLRRVKQLLDFERFREHVKDCHSPAIGRTAEAPVRLLKLEFLQFHYNLSDREVIAAAQVNVAFRCFLDLALESRLPVPSLPSQFRTRLGAQRHQAPFDEVVAQARGNTVAALSMDGRGWHGEVLRQLSAPQGLGVEVYVPPPPQQQGAYFRPEQFARDVRGEVLTCPGGQQTTARARNAHNRGWQFTFARHLCAGCAWLGRCLGALPQHRGWSVIKNDYQGEYDAARERAQTPRYAEVRRQHPRVERKLADMAR